MLNSDKLYIENIIDKTRSSERKFKEGNFKGAIDERREVRSLLNSEFCDKAIIKKFKEELSNLYSSKFDQNKISQFNFFIKFVFIGI